MDTNSMKNRTLSAEALKDLRLAAVSLLAEEESRIKSNRMIYYTPNSRYVEMMRFNETLEPKELGHGFTLDNRKRGIK